MRPRWSGVVGEKTCDRAVRGDLDARTVLGERALHGGVPRDGRAAARRDNGEEQDRAEDYERGTLSPGRCMRFSTSATPRMRLVRATISTIIAGASISPRSSTTPFSAFTLIAPFGPCGSRKSSVITFC